MSDFDEDKRSLKNELNDFIEDVTNDEVDVEDLLEDCDSGEDFVRLDGFSEKPKEYRSKAEELLDEVYDAKTEDDIGRLLNKFKNLKKSYDSVRPNDLLI